VATIIPVILLGSALAISSDMDERWMELVARRANAKAGASDLMPVDQLTLELELEEQKKKDATMFRKSAAALFAILVWALLGIVACLVSIAADESWMATLALSSLGLLCSFMLTAMWLLRFVVGIDDD
jgi:hypothetical protein